MGKIRNKRELIISNISDVVHNYYAVNSIDGRIMEIKQKVVRKFHQLRFSFHLAFLNTINLNLRWKILN